MIAIGIDPSLTSTGIAICCPTVRQKHKLLHAATVTSEPSGTGMLPRLARCVYLCDQIKTNVLTWAHDADSVSIAIEGYSFGSKGNSAVWRSEFGGLLRMMLLRILESGIPGNLYEVPPKTVKMFAADNGNADKQEVARVLEERYGVRFVTERGKLEDDKYDAYALARIAMCVDGKDEPMSDKQHKAVETVREQNPELMSKE